MVFETKEQIIRRNKMARYRFRAIIRKAWLNSYWLSELDDLSLSDNVEKNIAIILNRSKTKRSVLTIHDKTILRTPLSERTKDDTKSLVKLIDELPCFKSFTPFIREKLIEVVEFKYFEKDRMILKEGHKSYSMYFIATGEVRVSQLKLEEGVMVNKPVNILSAGEYFGHVGLIYNIPRNASVSTQSGLTMNSLRSFERILASLSHSNREKVHRCIDLLNRCLLLLPIR